MKDAIKEHGISITSSTTWEDFIAALSEKAGDQVAKVEAGFK